MTLPCLYLLLQERVGRLPGLIQHYGQTSRPAVYGVLVRIPVPQDNGRAAQSTALTALARPALHGLRVLLPASVA